MLELLDALQRAIETSSHGDSAAKSKSVRTNSTRSTTAIGAKFDFYGDERRGISIAV